MNQHPITMLLLAATVALAGCGKRAERAEVPSADRLPIAVATPTVKDVVLTRQYPGYLSADAAVEVVCRVNGQLVQSYVSAGQRVRRPVPQLPA